MEKYKRLTFRHKSVVDGTEQIGYTEKLVGYYRKEDIILNRLAELEDKIENGTLRFMPCKVGDTVYYETFINGESKGIIPHKVIGFVLEAMTQNMDGFGCTSVPIRDFGKDIFLTKAEAEKKLKEKENE